QNSQLGSGPRVLGRLRELEAKHKDGSLFPVTIGLNEAEWLGEPCYIGSIRDISERREAEHTIESLSMFDPLTGLPNRAHFIKLMQHQLHYSNVRV
ncbi:PAS domain S-box protein, partial [Salmonella sp. ZJHZ21_0203]|uniref:PAS domain S-box protein n=1 Tax=Salmonella sp. ZJHZ21_0203 TaxID=3159609 RepID=UPI0039811071